MITIEFDSQKIYYVYAWYYEDSKEVFHIGKGKGNRYKDIKNHRNNYFKNIIAKNSNNVNVKILYKDLDEKTALELERKLIKEYKKGECKTNFHEGGCGGNTGNYNNSERSRKLSEAGKKLVGEKNPMYGKTHSQEARQKISEANKGKVLSKEHIEKLRQTNTGRKINFGNRKD